jgi:hypothetical protein
MNEDHYALLVKAWEQRVFPVIRRRFRNEAERKDGLEQIRGALQLGKIFLFGCKTRVFVGSLEPCVVIAGPQSRE